MTSLTLLQSLYLELCADFVPCFTVIVIGFEEVNLHWEEACHALYIATIYMKHEMILYAQSGMEFHREEKGRGGILQLDQFHTILV